MTAAKFIPLTVCGKLSVSDVSTTLTTLNRIPSTFLLKTGWLDLKQLRETAHLVMDSRENSNIWKKLFNLNNDALRWHWKADMDKLIYVSLTVACLQRKKCCVLLYSSLGYQIFKHGFPISKHVRASRHVKIGPGTRTPTHGDALPPRPGKNLVFLQIFLGFQVSTYKPDTKLRPTSTIKSKDKSTEQWKPKNVTKLKNLVFSSPGWMCSAMCGSARECGAMHGNGNAVPCVF